MKALELIYMHYLPLVVFPSTFSLLCLLYTYMYLHTRQRALKSTPPHKINSLQASLPHNKPPHQKTTLHFTAQNLYLFYVRSTKAPVFVPVGAPGNEWVAAGRPSLAFTSAQGSRQRKGYKTI